jgi:hypothetical protein
MGSQGSFEVQRVMFNRPRRMTFLLGKVVHGSVEVGDWVLIPGHPSAEKVAAMCGEKDNLIQEADATKLEVVLAFRGIFEFSVQAPFNVRLTGKW